MRKKNCMYDITCISCLYLQTYSMEQSPSWQANRFSAGHEIPRILWNPKRFITYSQVPATCTYPE